MKLRTLIWFITTGFSLILLSCNPFQNSFSQDQELLSTINAMEQQIGTLSSDLNADDINGYEGDDNSDTSVSTPTQETLPVEPVPAGIPILFGGWALTLSREINVGEGFWTDVPYIELQFTIRNITEESRIFRFIKSGIQVKDDLGNSYPYYMMIDYCEANPDDIYLDQQISIKGGEKENIKSSDDNFACSIPEYIPPFQGTIPGDANRLYITVSDWASFNNVIFYIDL